jgi:hypothetical protein
VGSAMGKINLQFAICILQLSIFNFVRMSVDRKKQADLSGS